MLLGGWPLARWCWSGMDRCARRRSGMSVTMVFRIGSSLQACVGTSRAFWRSRTCSSSPPGGGTAAEGEGPEKRGRAGISRRTAWPARQRNSTKNFWRSGEERGGMKVVVTGATGQLGTEMVNALAGEQVEALGRLELDLCDFVYSRTRISGIRPDVVVNAAAFTRVDDCETEPERAFWVNTYAVRNLAQGCADIGCVLGHVSTDYVFDGMKTTPYTE